MTALDHSAWPSEIRDSIKSLTPIDTWATIIRADLGRAVEGIIAAGQHLQQAKAEIEHGDWLPLLKALRLDESAAQRLMKIAGNEVLANPAHWAAFPPSWRTLYELTKLPPPLLEAKIIDGTITPDLERRDIAALKGKSPSVTDTTEKKPPSRRELAKEVEAQRAHIEELQAARESPTEFALADAEKMRRLEIENGALKTEIEELKAERDALRARVGELERESEAAKTGGGAPVEKRKRGRPKGSKNKPKVR
jgi:hypothetical protein